MIGNLKNDNYKDVNCVVKNIYINYIDHEFYICNGVSELCKMRIGEKQCTVENNFHIIMHID